MISLHSVEGNTQRLDGGAMYGNAPKAVWTRWSPPDEHNRIGLACRALLVQDGSRKVLFEVGVGAFFDPHLRERFGVVEQQHVLLSSLQRVGVSHDQIDVVVLSHLHFDHAGGLLSAWSADEQPRLLFPNATFLVGKKHWERATNPHPRDRASFIPHLNKLLEDSGRLVLVDGDTSPVLPAEVYRFRYSDGHTPGLTMTTIQTERGPVTFVGDLIPGVPWVHLPITMGYDRYAEHLIDEKRALLDDVIAQDGWVFFTHDPKVSAARIRRSDKGRYTAIETTDQLVWT